ncbi:hypothetical protein B0T22DRAFT_440295 [Podospora appendiculata]|uniref:Uncharacterized protein n=1 Tax=Podospora appendiculata TaxID=314037 RepID=A0AAE0XA25_9PEZI|nr:hypothetical protein B0T22DRAFT_440295 [Podospora appendiculata]
MPSVRTRRRATANAICTNLANTTLNSSELDVIHLMVKHNISAVSTVDQGFRLLNVFEAVDVTLCIRHAATTRKHQVPHYYLRERKAPEESSFLAALRSPAPAAARRKTQKEQKREAERYATVDKAVAYLKTEGIDARQFN